MDRGNGQRYYYLGRDAAGITKIGGIHTASVPSSEESALLCHASAGSWRRFEQHQQAARPRATQYHRRYLRMGRPGYSAGGDALSLLSQLPKLPNLTPTPRPRRSPQPRH